MELPVVERSWRAYRGAGHNHAVLMAHLETLVPRWTREQLLIHREVTLPGPFVEEYLRNLIGAEPYLEQIVMRDSASMTAYSAYRRTKIIYRLNEHLAWALLEAKWPGAYPLDQLRLPHNGMVIDVPPQIMRHLAGVNGALTDLSPEEFAIGLSTYKSWNQFICYYDLESLQDQDRTSSPRIAIRVGRLGIPDSERVYAAGKFPLQGCKTLDESWRQFVARADDMWAQHGCEPPSKQMSTAGVDDRLPLFRLLLNAILYIQGDDDVVATVHPGQRPTKSSKNPVKARRFQDLAIPRTFEVGSRYGAMIERWEIEEGKELGAEGEDTGRTVRPHLRAAHAHLYWTGPGRTEARVRFLPPIKVKGGFENIEAPVVVVKHVR